MPAKIRVIASLLCLLVLSIFSTGYAQGSITEEAATPHIPAQTTDQPVVRIVMFWMESCGFCHQVISNVLPPLQEQYGDQLEILLIELSTREEVDMLYQIAGDHGMDPGMVGVPFLIIGQDVLVGSIEIPEKLPGLVEQYLAAGGVDYPEQVKPQSEEPLEPETVAVVESTSTGQVPVYFFWGDGCPHCATQKPFMAELERRYPEVILKSYEVWSVEENRQIFFEMAAASGFEPQAVPTTFIGDQVWTGFYEGMKRELEAAIVACIETACPDPGLDIPGAGVVSEEPVAIPAEPIPAPAEIERETMLGTEAETEAQGAIEVQEEQSLITLPLLGVINLNAQSLPFSTAVIAFVDGFNPCSLWVLSILLALVIHSGSRRKTLLVGLTFLLVTAGVYGLFIAGLFKVFTIVSFIGWVQVIVALLALGFALVNIKDYFWYKEGLSFTISDKHKPKIYRDMRGIISGEKSSLALIGATIVMALGIALVELPCTAGFPVLWSKMVSAHQVSTMGFIMLLGLYLLIYLLDELLIFFTAVVTLKASKLEEKHGRVLKLVGGVVMLALAIVLLVDPELMNNFGNSLLVFAAAFGGALMILLLHKVILPKFGIVIGTEDAKKAEKLRKKRAT
jgi:cytochrome c biogenesis protein CcdA/thiol-disulfide isomerase/thioredoxin